MSETFASYREPLVAPISPDQLVVFKNGIDTRLKRSRGTPFLYEELCFQSITSDSPTTVVLGPHLLDQMLGAYPETVHKSRPDAIHFSKTAENVWILQQLFEFKSGFNLYAERKLYGFSQLLKNLRKQPLLLPHLLQDTLAEYDDLPASITIPEDTNLHVTFISPQDHCQPDVATDFHIGVTKLPLPKHDYLIQATQPVYAYTPAPYYALG